MGSLSARLVPALGLGADDERAWHELAATCLEPNPLFEPECIFAAARQRPDDALHMLITEGDGRFYACLPLVRTDRWHRLPYPVATTQVRRMTYLGTPLVAPERSVEALAVALEALADDDRRLAARLLDVHWIGAGGRVEESLRAAAGDLGMPVQAYESFERGVVRRRAGGAIGSPPRQTPGEMRRRLRRLGDELGGEVRLVDRSDDPEAIETYLRLEGSGYKLDNGVAMLANPGEPEYFREMCHRFGAASRLHVLSLEADRVPAAMEIWLRAQEGLFMIKTSYDERFRRFCPGVQLHLDGIRHFHEQTDARFIDTCTYADNELLLGLYPERRYITSLVVGLTGRVDGLVVGSYLGARSLYRRRRPRPRSVAPVVT